MANDYFKYGWHLIKVSPGNYQIDSSPGYDFFTVGYYATDDVTDPGGDDPTQLGDVSSDTFHFHNAGAGDNLHTLTYLGKTTTGQSIITKFGPGTNNYYLYTNSPSNYASESDVPFVASDGTPATAYALCFATGTLIRKARGDVAVEDLREGEEVITASGEARAIKWIGHRRTDCAHHPRPKDVWPVLVEAGALGNATPSRDLYLSPFHAVALTCGSEVLVPVHCLINGTTIRQVPVDEITYWHVELETHDIIVANGAAAESYLDTGNRSGFQNAQGAIDLHPDFKPAEDADFCRPLVTSGPILSAIRASLPAPEASRSLPAPEASRSLPAPEASRSLPMRGAAAAA